MLLWPTITVRQIAHGVPAVVILKNTLLSLFLPQIFFPSPSDLFLSVCLDLSQPVSSASLSVTLDSSYSRLSTWALSTFSSRCPFRHELTPVRNHKVQPEPLCVSVIVTLIEIAVNSSLCWRAPSFPLSVTLCSLHTFSFYLWFC